MKAPKKKSALGLLRLLLVASVAVPATLFIVTSWFDYGAKLAAARHDLDRTSEIARENAARVFEREDDVADHINDIVRGMTVAEVHAHELGLHQQFTRLVAHIPEIQDVLLVDAKGQPLVSSAVYPVPQTVSISRRDFFKAVMSGRPGPFISRPQMGAIQRQRFFGFARAWTDGAGTIKGVINIPVSPGYFGDFYGLLLNEGETGNHGKILALLRSDGQILVRYPPAQGRLPRIDASSPFFKAVAEHPDRGRFTNRSVVERGRPRRIFFYRQVGGFPLYVVAGNSIAAILAQWWQTIGGRLIIGGPATMALFAITWVALVRTRREEEALAQADAEIAKRERAEQALMRAQRLEAVGQLTGGVAHDFNNLLTVIIGSVELLERRPDDLATVRRLAGNIRFASERGAEITAKLLSFSRRHRVNPEILDVNARLRAFEPLLRQAVNEAITIVFDLVPDVGMVSLDPGEFESAVLNLVGNARDAMPWGGRIRITTRNDFVGAGHGEMKAGPVVRIAVRDNGQGMDAETAAKAVEPFFTTKGVGRGTGLGLSQVYGFVRQSGGDLSIETALGEGTSIEIVLPASGTEGSPPALTPAPLAAPLASPVAPVLVPAGAEGDVVLVVEDEPDVREIAVEGLRALGYATLSAGDAEAALDILRREARIDLLFSDVVMPGARNGVQLCEEARRLRPGLKVLLTSGYNAVPGPAADGVAVLPKPYDQARLADRVRAVLQGEARPLC